MHFGHLSRYNLHVQGNSFSLLFPLLSLTPSYRMPCLFIPTFWSLLNWFLFLLPSLVHVCQRPSPHIAKDFLIPPLPSSLKYFLAFSPSPFQWSEVKSSVLSLLTQFLLWTVDLLQLIIQKILSSRTILEKTILKWESQVNYEFIL